MSLDLHTKYELYERAVQNPQNEVDFMQEWFVKERGFKPHTLREDFCGTAAISHAWVKSNSSNKAFGIDLDLEPINIGKTRHGSKLTNNELNRLEIINGNVLSAQKFKVDIVCAFNFSYFIFKTRPELLKYFKQVRAGLNSKGVFYLDLFGGPDSQKQITESRNIRGNAKYYWECQDFNPINSHCHFAIHFKYKNKKYHNVFTYDWRLWSIVELREILCEAGFSKSMVFWEGDGKDGTGDGIFVPQESAENSLAWVTYLGAFV